MRQFFCALMCCGVVTGCGSSSPIAMRPAASPPIPMEIQAFEQLVGNSNTATVASALSGAPATVTIAQGIVGDGNIEVTVGTKVYELGGSVDGGVPVFTDTTSGSNVKIEQVSQESDVTLALIHTGDGASDDPTGYSALGSVTDPAELAALQAANSDVLFEGKSYLDKTQGTLSDSASGNLNLLVDFGAGTFDGSMDLTSVNDDRKNFEVTNVNAMIENGVIKNGALQADVNIDVVPADPNIITNGANQLGFKAGTTGSLAGNFYGASAANVGGTFNITGTEPRAFPAAKPQSIVVQGGFTGMLKPTTSP